MECCGIFQVSSPAGIPTAIPPSWRPSQLAATSVLKNNLLHGSKISKSLVMRSLKRKAGMHGMVYVMTPDAKVMDKILAAAQQATKNMIAHQISAEAEGQKEAPMAIG